MTRVPRSTQLAAQQTDQAADQLLDWLQQQHKAISAEKIGDKAAPTDIDFCCKSAYDVGEVSEPSQGSALHPKGDSHPLYPLTYRCSEDDNPLSGVRGGVSHGSNGPSQATRNANGGGALELAWLPRHLPHTDWLHHSLDVTGPEAALMEFRAAASGAGTIPWPLDRERMTEDLFHLLAAPHPPQRRRLSLAGARILARQLCDAAELRHAAALARVGHSRACPFDLHALVPVPPDILPSGPDHPDSLAWLWAHWGTTLALRHVAIEPALVLRQPLPAGTMALRLSFWSADWTPWQALATVASRWPALRFDVCPTYRLL